MFLLMAKKRRKFQPILKFYQFYLNKFTQGKLALLGENDFFKRATFVKMSFILKNEGQKLFLKVKLLKKYIIFYLNIIKTKSKVKNGK